MTRPTRIFFATDIHASNRCFKKFLNAAKHYEADVLVLGGDVTGKAFVPVVMKTAGSGTAVDNGKELELETATEISRFEERASDAGSYVFRCCPEEYRRLLVDGAARDELFNKLIEERIRAWVSLADERLHDRGIRVFFNAGNDDHFSIDPLIDASTTMVRPEDRCVEVDDYCTMISTGFANVTPFHCPRDVLETELTRKIENMVSDVADLGRCIFNFHCPPFQSNLDNAPKLDGDLRPQMTGLGIEFAPVGSTAVRTAIERHQPLLGLHGHIHESKGIAYIGRTLCLNPGSEYHEGILRGALIQLQRGAVQHYMLTSG